LDKTSNEKNNTCLVEEGALSLSQRIEQRLQQLDCEGLARRSGFQKRKAIKIRPLELLKALCLVPWHGGGSLTSIAIILGLLTGQVISKQGVSKRCSLAAVAFVRQTLYSLLQSMAQMPRLAQQGVFAAFGRVLIHDSTNLALASRLAQAFPGSRNQSGKTFASLKIQTIYDLLTESFLHFQLDLFTRNDQCAAPDILKVARAGDLILRDLGYFVLSCFQKMNQRGIFFLSRLRYGTALFTQDGKQLFPLLSQLRCYGTLDIQLLLGANEKLPVRLVAVPLPPDVAAARRRKARQNRDRRCHPSQEQLALLDWEIFITNVPPSRWKTSTVAQVYGLRWRIEIIFKTWKSHFGLPHLPAGSPAQVQLLILARLIFLTLFQTALFLPLFLSSTHLISLLKVARFLATNPLLLLPSLLNPTTQPFLLKLIHRHCTYEKRKTRLNYPQTLQALG